MTQSYQILEVMVLTDNKKIARRIVNAKFIKAKEMFADAFITDTPIRSLVCSRAFVAFALRSKLPDLRFIQLLSAGYEGVDLIECSRRGILVANAANVYSVGMAEFVVYCMLRSAKRYNASIRNTRIRIQRDYRYITELAGRSVSILGVGGIGGEVARRLKAFDMTVYGFAKNTQEKMYFDGIVHSIDELKSILHESDYVVSTLPDNKDTFHFIDMELLNCLREDVTIVNVGRRKVFDEDALFAYLKKHKRVTAFLDMFERLPNPITNRFHRLQNVCVLPGVTAISQEIDEKLFRLVETNLIRVSHNELPINLLNHD